MAVQTQVACDLCGLERFSLQWAATIDGEERHFCCAGCRQVYQILVESGQIDPQAREASPQYRWARDAGLLSRPEGDEPEQEEEPETVRELALHLEGLWCSSCGWLIERALRRLRGVVRAEVLFVSDLLQVGYDPTRISPDAVQERVAELGYRAAPYGDEEDEHRRATREMLMRLGAAGVLAMNVMVLNLVLYSDLFVPLGPDGRGVLPWVLMALTVPAIFWAGWPVLSRGLRALIAGAPNMETLIGTSVMTTFAYSVYVTVSGGYHVYYDTATMLVALILLGRYLESLARERANASITALHRRRPLKARLRQGEEERFVALEALEPSDVVRVLAGETLPVDGQVVGGAAAVDESMLTGEPRPVQRGMGADVVGGTRVVEGEIDVRVDRLGEQSVLGQILRYVDGALTQKSAAERKADQFARYFVPVIFGVAAATFAAAYWLHWEADLGGALMRAATVMIIACPCSLALATPIATVAAVGRAADQAVLIANSEALERAGRVRTVLLDKTGTVTKGAFALLAIHAPAEDGDRALVLAAAAEARSRHPLAAPLRQAAAERGLDLPPAEAVLETEGQGVQADVDGLRVCVGNRQSQAGSVGPDLEAWAQERESQGHTVVFVGWNQQTRAAIALGDSIREDARETMQRLKDLGLRPCLISGDAPATTRVVAAQIGVEEWAGGLSPAQKVERVKELQSAGEAVAVVGDGVNDAPALAQADVGIAMGSGADVAMGAAEMTLLSGDLARLPDAIQLARQSLRVIRQNLFWAAIYNIVAIPLAIAGILSPVVAAVAMLLSSLSVTLNSLRLRRG